MDKLDLTQPIKAHHRDGRVVEASAMPNGNVTWRDGNLHHCAIGTDGPLDTECGDWTLRNVICAKPSTPSNEELTQRMEIAAETQVRLAKLVHDMCEVDYYHAPLLDPLFDEARALKADLPKPVDPIDPDLIEARKMAATLKAAVPIAKEVVAGKRDHIEAVRTLLDAIKLGRTLAAGGTAHE